ncbi:DUF3369 domain-containing protein [Motiliproteus sp. SC1-56]|uniref:DUF3369 domain-containing protein n=1 Tax=Motiliproteus sp. SC1-56 TaxID=2799565 RepID=UPI001A8F5EEA|nr:DUF3369 domain-containing protein [Motiliproteus sp. SC1-56]
MSDELLFSDEQPAATADKRFEKPPWLVLVVDDEESVHRVTQLALGSMTYDERALELLHAYSADEARGILNEHRDIAVLLLDVVMESDRAGLDLVHYIRQELKNQDVRIVLRTGQPGQAPEQEVIATYDINDYRDKTELSAQKLYTLMIACLRAYRDIETLHKSRLGLEKVIRATRGIYEKHALTQFVDATLEQLAALLNLDQTVIYLYQVKAFCPVDGEFEVILPGQPAGETKFVRLEELEPAVRRLLEASIQAQQNQFEDQRAAIFCAGQQHVVMFYLEGPVALSTLDQHLINMLTENLNIALDNIDLSELLRSTQQELVYRMGDMVENHSPETGSHVKRVALYCEQLARLAGLGEEAAQMIKDASPLHDLGKIGVADAVLKKPGQLTHDEWQQMKKHATFGHRMLAGSGLPLLDAGADIARHHHERWDGKGYPDGLQGDEIPVWARIATIADVFDALSTRRCYKEPWPMEKVVKYIEERSGSVFDPDLVQLFTRNLDAFIAIRERHPDPGTSAS